MLDFHEKQLIARAQAGDTQAFNPLVAKYQPYLHNHILGKVKHTETAKDLTQETWLKVFRAIHTFRGDAAFSSWLYRIAANVCIDYHRRQKAFFHTEPLYTINEHRIATFHPDPCDLLQQQELQQHLCEAIAALTPPRRRVFLLYYFGERSIKDIARRLKKSEGTIKSHLRNARIQLQEHLTLYLKNENVPRHGFKETTNSNRRRENRKATPEC